MRGLRRFTGPQDAVAKMCAEFDKRRKVVVAGLTNCRASPARRRKARSIRFPNVKKTGWKAKALASSLLEDSGGRHHRRTRISAFSAKVCAFVLRQLDREYPQSPHRMGESSPAASGVIRDGAG